MRLKICCRDPTFGIGTTPGKRGLSEGWDRLLIGPKHNISKTQQNQGVKGVFSFNRIDISLNEK